VRLAADGASNKAERRQIRDVVPDRSLDLLEVARAETAMVASSSSVSGLILICGSAG
jgi:hypothetical protein